MAILIKKIFKKIITHLVQINILNLFIIYGTKIASYEISGICNLCLKLYYSMMQKLLRIKHNKPVESYYSPRKQKCIKILQLSQKNIKTINNRAMIKIKRLKNALSDVHLQYELIKEIFAASKTNNSKGCSVMNVVLNKMNFFKDQV